MPRAAATKEKKKKENALVIVESPTKAKTISKFLGKGFTVESSYGHVRDLPKSKLGIDLEHDFEPQYVVPRKNNDHVKALKKAVAKATRVILAPDEDREGEAIAWHLAKVLGIEPEKAERIVFHEITQSAIEEALAHPRGIYSHLVDAQQARRVLDRLVGYKLSPFLWKKVARGLSAGRVQSVALRLIVDRENEIKAFKPEEYWSVAAILSNHKGEIEAQLAIISQKTLDKLDLKTEARVKEITKDLETASWKIQSVEKKATIKNPPAPFTTSTLQQAAAARLGFSSQKTMYVAQQLYENGYITYMRTDSVNLSKEALEKTHGWIKDNFSKEYHLQSARAFKNSSRNAQEAHEAIRPTNPTFAPLEFTPEGTDPLEKDHRKLYDLIWRRLLASQLPEAQFDATKIEIEAKAKENYQFNAHGNMLKFDGFLKVWPTKFEEKDLPPLEQGQALDLKELKPEQHFTEPPPRYNEASLIKTLEKHGIGRPSTYAPIIAVIQKRNYVEKIQRRFHPTEIGMMTSAVLAENFPKVVDIEFTAKMEENLDDIAEGKAKWNSIIREFYDPFAKELEVKYEEVKKITPEAEPTGENCELCGKPMVIKFGRFGKFIACSGFPECKNTKKIQEPPKLTGVKCSECKIGELIERRVSRGKARGKIFWGCNRYPECKHATWTNPTKKEEEKDEAPSKDLSEEGGE